MTPRNGPHGLRPRRAVEGSSGSHVGRWLHALPVGAAISLGAAAGACGGANRPNSNETPPELPEGRDIYRSRCAPCHGSNGGGGVEPALADGRVVKRYPDIADNIAVIRDGRGSMPAWGEVLTPAEIEAVVHYERDDL